MHVVAITYLVPRPFAATHSFLNWVSLIVPPAFHQATDYCARHECIVRWHWGGGHTSTLDAIRKTCLWFLATGSQQGTGKEGIAFIHFSVTIRIDPPTAAFMPSSTRPELC